MLFQLMPAALPDGYGEALLPLADAKAWLRIEAEIEDEDALIAALRDAAIDMVERYTNLSLGRRTGLIATFAGFGERMRVGVGPEASLSVTGISYPDAAGDPVAMEAGIWRIDMAGGLVPKAGTAWPATDGPVTVTFDAGYQAGACPPALIHAAKLFLAHLYAHREAAVSTGVSGELTLGFRTLCDRYRMPVL